jgi:hypothetical protein
MFCKFSYSNARNCISTYRSNSVNRMFAYTHDDTTCTSVSCCNTGNLPASNTFNFDSDSNICISDIN